MFYVFLTSIKNKQKTKSKPRHNLWHQRVFNRVVWNVVSPRARSNWPSLGIQREKRLIMPRELWNRWNDFSQQKMSNSNHWCILMSGFFSKCFYSKFIFLNNSISFSLLYLSQDLNLGSFPLDSAFLTTVLRDFIDSVKQVI